MAELEELNSNKQNNIKIVNNDTTKLNNTVIKKKPIERKRSFIKTPSFTEYLERFQNGEYDASKKPEVIFCGQQSYFRQVLIIILLFIFFVSSSIGVYYLWYTDSFEAAILQVKLIMDSFLNIKDLEIPFIDEHTLLKNLILANNTAAFFMWKTPTVKTLLKVRIYNYTNVDAFLAKNDTKLKIQEVGPFVYEETMERVNIVFNDNGTVSYQENRIYNFRADLSSPWKQSDKVIVPNVPLLGAMALTRDSYFVARWTLNRITKEMDTQPFVKLPAHKFLWGYDDKFISLARGVLAFKKDISFDTFGLIALRNGTSRDRITIYTGQTDLNKLGLIDQFNGQRHTDFWSTRECNRVDGTDGAHFPLDAIHNLERIYVYNKEICRKIPFDYTESVMVQLNNDIEMPALRYKFPKNVFSSPEILPENQCFCDLDSGICPPEGVFNATRCLYGLPFYPSFPHFYLADPELTRYIDGLKPDPEKHATYLDIHPNLAFPISGSSRMQINIKVRTSEDIEILRDVVDDGFILPIAWLEVSLGDLPQDIIDILYHATFSAATMKTVLRFLALIIAGITLSLLMTWFYANYTSKLYQERLAKRILSEETNGTAIVIRQPIS